MDVSKTLRPLREAAGLTQQDLADRLEVSRVAVWSWEVGKATPRPAKLEQLAAIFGVPVSELLGEDAAAPAQALPPRARRVAGRSGTVPMRRLGRTHAGEAVEEVVDEGVVEVPAHVAALHPHGFCLEVEGHCMDRAYPDGCVVLVDPDAEPWPGCAVVAETGPGESVLRRYNRGASTLMLSPDSHDPGFADMVFDDEELQEVRTLGVVVWYQAPHDEFEEF